MGKSGLSDTENDHQNVEDHPSTSKTEVSGGLVFRGGQDHFSTAMHNLTPEARATLGAEGPEHDHDSFGWTEPKRIGPKAK